MHRGAPRRMKIGLFSREVGENMNPPKCDDLDYIHFLIANIHLHRSRPVPTRREGASSRRLYPSAAKTV
ncbi:hypothetical protein HKBW3C_02381, partial [Candidatus Hakubella thermalkaliphila]